MAQVHTSAYDESIGRIRELGVERVEQLPRHEQRLFKQGGIEAVWEERRWRAKEAGDPNWNSIGRTI